MRWLRIGFLPVSVVILVSAAMVVPLPYYVERPGRVLSLDDCVQVGGDAAGPVQGDFLLMTINVLPATAVEAALGIIESDALVVGARALVPPGQDTRTYFRQQRKDFRSSADVAAAVGLDAAGLPTSVEGEGARILQVYPGTPAEGVLQPGDVVVGVDSEPIATDLELRDAISNTRVGRPVGVDVVRNGRKVSVELATVRINDAPAIGVVPETVNARVVLPVDVNVQSGTVGGPSAGLMIALTVYDKVMPDVDLAAGRVVAGTGTIDQEGHVGPVGGAGLKVIAAHRRGADIFLAPKNDVAAIKTFLPAGSPVQVVGVETFEEARRALLDSAPAAPETDDAEGRCPYAEAA